MIFPKSPPFFAPHFFAAVMAWLGMSLDYACDSLLPKESKLDFLGDRFGADSTHTKVLPVQSRFVMGGIGGILFWRSV